MKEEENNQKIAEQNFPCSLGGMDWWYYSFPCQLHWH